MTDNSAPFPRLRTAYLRAIARAWHDPRYLEQLLQESAGPRGVLPMLEQEYGFVFPFNVRLILSTKRQPIWGPNYTTGWYGFGDEFKLYLPASPSRVEERAAVAMQYYAEFPSLLGAATDPFTVAPDDFGAFGSITVRILALTWESELFRTALYTSNDSRVQIQDAMDYMVPWNFSLVIREAPGASSTSPAYWRDFPRSEITLHIPMRPETLAVEAAALAAYNDTGSQYPFSC